MKRRNFIQSIVIGVFGASLPYSTRGIRKKREVLWDSLHNSDGEEIKWDRVYEINRRDVKGVKYVEGVSMYGMAYMIFDKYEYLEKIILKINFERMRYRLYVDLSNTNMIYFKKWMDCEVKPAGIWFEYQNYNGVI